MGRRPRHPARTAEDDDRGPRAAEADPAEAPDDAADAAAGVGVQPEGNRATAAAEDEDPAEAAARAERDRLAARLREVEAALRELGDPMERRQEVVRRWETAARDAEESRRAHAARLAALDTERRAAIERCQEELERVRLLTAEAGRLRAGLDSAALDSAADCGVSAAAAAAGATP